MKWSAMLNISGYSYLLCYRYQAKFNKSAANQNSWIYGHQYAYFSTEMLSRVQTLKKRFEVQEFHGISLKLEKDCCMEVFSFFFF